MRTGLVFIALIGTFPAVWTQPNFVESADEWNLDHTYGVGSPGGGVSIFDFNQDGWDDLTLATGLDSLLHFYQNNNGHLERIPPLIDNRCEQKQVLWADYDNDGDQDLMVACYGDVNRLYVNLGELQLVDMTEEAHLPLDSFLTYGANFADINRDGWLDLYFAERRGPSAADENRNRLFLHNRDGTFTEVHEDSGIGDPMKKPFCSTFFDYNNDRWPDLYTANDKLTINTLLKNQADRTFADVSIGTGTNLSMNAMCVTIGDYDNDGWQDIYVTNTQEGGRLFHNLGSNSEFESVTFDEVATSKGVDFLGGIGWGSVFLDAENDGDLDLYVSGSLVGSDKQSAAFFENLNGESFERIEGGFAGDTVQSYSSAYGDLDNNGFIDIIVSNHAPFQSHLWLNSSSKGNWIKIDLEGVLSNRNAIGTKLEIFDGSKYQMRYIHCGSGFLGQNTGSEIFGLDKTLRIDSLLVTWPSGHQDRLVLLDANQRIQIIEGSTTNGIIHVDPDIDDITTQSEYPQATRKINIYPNPVTDRITVLLPESRYGRLFLLNVMGLPVYEIEVRNHKKIEIDATGIPPGIYFMNYVSIDQRQRATIRCIKL
ncbi:MAG: FG-GAP-like repeat-containing protein [Saprospiraceae bacterium]|nr:FG-GAP-like repeat-containing protein [Saprospiraceae bacterium]